ncbi:MAG: hypothetical protein IT317_21595 [Anaerolineales bacterium]|nr:hypothetical protein [Anaerolineales bacterium]
MEAKPAPSRPPRAPRAARRSGGCLGRVLNLLATLLFLGTLLVLALVVLLFNFPGVLRFVPGGSAYLPPTPPAVAEVIPVGPRLSPTPGPSPTLDPNSLEYPTLPPEWTATHTPTVTNTPLPRTPTSEPTETQPRATRTPTVTQTPTTTPTRTPTKTPAGPTPTATNTRSPQAYTLQTGSPTYLSNFLNQAGCAWFGIAGRAFALDGSVVIGLTVKVRAGDIDLPPVLTGSAKAIGTGGYEVFLSDHPIASTNVYKVQLFNANGAALSEQYSLTTFGDCTKNLVMVNFVQNH